MFYGVLKGENKKPSNSKDLKRITVANLVTIFNPELIILGGELSKAGQEFIGAVKVVRSKMKEDPPLIGAYALALEMLFSIEKWNL